MLFNSFTFLVFFIIVYSLYLKLDHRRQNRMLLAASYIFYGWWDARFLILLFVSSGIDFFCGHKIFTANTSSRKKMFLALSITSNLTILGFFKYYDFFAESLRLLLEYWGITADIRLLHMVLPVGISFYTFQAMSYALDIYRGQLKPTKDLGDFLLIVSFFPHLVAGPIQRASNLLAQVATPRRLSREQLTEGVWLFFYGLFQKAYVADNLAKLVDPVYASPQDNGTIVLFATYAYAFQIYCDFAGYSNMARGLAKLMGFEFMLNFRTPYFSTNPREFWHRWHISLSTWLRDYLYISLGGNRKGALRTYINLFLTMLLGGLWHGAAWHFVLWGAYHGALLMVHRWFEENILARWKGLLSFGTSAVSVWLGYAGRALGVIAFFHIVCLGWIFFRAQSLEQVTHLAGLVVSQCQWTAESQTILYKLLFFGLPALFFDILEYRHDTPCFILAKNPYLQAAAYFFIYYCLMIYGIQGGAQFVYFQF